MIIYERVYHSTFNSWIFNYKLAEQFFCWVSFFLCFSNIYSLFISKTNQSLPNCHIFLIFTLGLAFFLILRSLSYFRHDLLLHFNLCVFGIPSSNQQILILMVSFIGTNLSWILSIFISWVISKKIFNIIVGNSMNNKQEFGIGIREKSSYVGPEG